MKKILNALAVFLFIFCTNASAQNGFSGGGGFSFYAFNPELNPINDQLTNLGMPQIDNTMVLYGGQGFAHVSYRLRIGGMGFGGQSSVSDIENGYAREVAFSMAWGGFMAEYVIWESSKFEFYGGGTLGWGGVWVRMEKTAAPVDWDEVWDNLEPTDSPSDIISSELTHSFFLIEPRLGMRFYLLSWLAVDGSVNMPWINLNSDGWRLNDKKVYNAPSLEIFQPFFKFGLFVGG